MEIVPNFFQNGCIVSKRGHITLIYRFIISVSTGCLRLKRACRYFLVLYIAAAPLVTF